MSVPLYVKFRSRPYAYITDTSELAYEI
jgi:hypothetical protein